MMSKTIKKARVVSIHFKPEFWHVLVKVEISKDGDKQGRKSCRESQAAKVSLSLAESGRHSAGKISAIFE
jgi:hypothetical protein